MVGLPPSALSTAASGCRAIRPLSGEASHFIPTEVGDDSAASQPKVPPTRLLVDGLSYTPERRGMPGFARLNAGVVRIGRQLAKRRNIMWRLEFDLSLEQNSPDQPGKRVHNGRSATPLIVISRFELPLLGSNQDSPDPQRTRPKSIFR